MYLTPLYELSRQIRQAEKELEELKSDPSATHDEIAEVDALLSKHKMEYSKRVSKILR